MTGPTGKNGCYDRRPLRTHGVVQDGWFMDGVTRVPKMIQIPIPMAADCQYTKSGLGQADKKCAGCKWRAEVPLSTSLGGDRSAAYQAPGRTNTESKAVTA